MQGKILEIKNNGKWYTYLSDGEGEGVKEKEFSKRG